METGKISEIKSLLEMEWGMSHYSRVLVKIYFSTSYFSTSSVLVKF